MDNLKHVIDLIYDFLAIQTEEVNMQVIDDIKFIKEEYDCFFLYTVLEPVDVDLFLINYVRYMKYRYEECPKIWYLQKFLVLKEQILKTAKRLDNDAITFCINDDSRDNFTKGFLFNETI